MKNSQGPALICFRWQGLTSNGRKRSGRYLATSESETREYLDRLHIRPLSVRACRLSWQASLNHQARMKDMTLITRQLETMLKAGVPVILALKLMAESQNRAGVKSILIRSVHHLESGMTLSQAFAAASPLFDNFAIDLIRSGEATGKLPEVMARLAQYREKQQELKAKMMKAMIYPLFVIMLSLIITTLMLVLVIPEFEAMFQSFNSELPYLTRSIIRLSEYCRDFGPYLFMTVTLLIWGLKHGYQRSVNFRMLLSRLSLKSPFLGSLLTKAAVARFSRTLATSFSAGLPILSSLDSAARTSGNLYFTRVIGSLRRETSAGLSLSRAMRNSRLFPDETVHFVMIGEESGKLDEMLNRIASIYESDIDHQVETLGQALEPAIIAILGGLISILVLAMYLPIFNLMSVLG